MRSKKISPKIGNKLRFESPLKYLKSSQENKEKVSETVGKGEIRSQSRSQTPSQFRGDLLTYVISALSPSPNEPEQVMVVRHNDDDTYEIILSKWGDDRSADVSGDMADVYYSSPDHSLIDIHTHPLPSPPSIDDFKTFATLKSIRTMLVVMPGEKDSHNYLVVELTKSDNYQEDDMGDVDEKLKMYDDKKIQDPDFPKNYLRSFGSKFYMRLKNYYLLGKDVGFDVRIYERDNSLYTTNSKE